MKRRKAIYLLLFILDYFPSKKHNYHIICPQFRTFIDQVKTAQRTQPCKMSSTYDIYLGATNIIPLLLKTKGRRKNGT